MNFLKLSLAAAIAATGVVLTGAAEAAPILEVHAALGPNIFGSPSYKPWTESATAALVNGTATGGTAGTPSFFEPVTSATSSDLIVTNFHSWRGQADPASVFGPAFADELGQRIHWVGIVRDDAGGTVDIASGLSQERFASPWRAAAGPDMITSYSALSATQPLRIGLEFGLDGLLGGGDDTVLTSGSGAVDAILFFIPGLGDEALSSSPDPLLQQAAIDAVTAPIDALGPFTLTYKFGFGGPLGVFAEASVAVNAATAVPEPAGLALFGVGLIGLAVLRRRKTA